MTIWLLHTINFNATKTPHGIENLSRAPAGVLWEGHLADGLTLLHERNEKWEDRYRREGGFISTYRVLSVVQLPDTVEASVMTKLVDMVLDREGVETLFD
jgi:hypothetical protein